MASTSPRGDRDGAHDPDGDLFDAVPVLGRATTHLERSFGPSCLLSLVIVLLLLVILRRYLQVSWTALACLVFFTWFAILALLVRWRPDRVVDEDF